jgi:hypothetical protein
MRHVELYAGVLLVALLLSGQSIQSPPHGAAANAYAGSTLPAQCSTGTLFFLTSAPPGANLYGCAAANVWAPEGRGADYSDSEAPSGAIDGVNTTFTLLQQPIPAASLLLARNGLLLAHGNDYTLSGNTITFVTMATPQPGDSLLAWYRY